MNRTILHVDLDAFYASVEQRDRPELRGHPVVVGGDSRRGVVAAASYEARRFGVSSAMSMVEAKRRCPQAVVVHPRMAHYSEESAKFFAILARYSPLIEGLSLDEAFLDVTGEERLFGEGEAIAERIRREVFDELSLRVSVGIASCKFVAKIATDLAKPNGSKRVRAEETVSFLHALPVSRLWGVGKATEEVLATLSVRTIGDVARLDERVLAKKLGEASAAHLKALSLGIDDRPVDPNRAPVSLGHENTFARDLFTRAELRTELLEQAEETCARLRSHALRGRTVTLKVKYGDHQIVTRRRTLDAATADGAEVGRVACALLDDVHDIELRGVRLSGVSVSSLCDAAHAGQLDFDAVSRARGEKLGETMDRIRAKFGDKALGRALRPRGDD